MSNFTGIVTSLPFILVMFTLLITLIGVLIARRSYVAAKDSEPWSIINLEGELWMLKRNAPVLATIHGIVVEEPAHIGTPNIEELGFNFINDTNGPVQFFEKGTSVIIKIDPRMTEAKFVLYYEEHKNKNAIPDETNYNEDMSTEEILPSAMKTWTANIHK